ncbi:3-hydroxyacyl-CoA dehydrogenase [Paracoccus onubensis]|uniref:3-hydroxyacyl-CoA dehydrogenase n=1 Tax=Paracoccus onubensis TaxID=1675788 RepID=UPI00272F83DA|nr:3-hydroxyacyl-CoA dehydrogenase [Paracoccus onubensis]MDP0929495.1 3-hydroxyacyl-CoA dehydrogenase [Paracoccus onubensis]
MRSVAIVGTGFIGRGWAVCFARSGWDVRLWDPVDGAAESARRYIADMLPGIAAAGLLTGSTEQDVLARISIASTLTDAVEGAAHVQENAPEDLALKRGLFRELDGLAAPDAVIASSTSALLPSAFTDHLPGRARCIVAHPVNPPHLIPLVELVPAEWTDETTTERTEALMTEIGQSPIRLQREIDGFLLNRLQAAILDEAFRLVAEGYASTDAIDGCVKDGLAMRWSFMGPFETIDLNAPGGVRDYVERYHGMFRGMTETMRHSADWAGPVLDRIEMERREKLSQSELPERQMWRDRQLMALNVHRSTHQSE